MILDKLTRLDAYASQLPHLKEAQVCLEQIQNAQPGRYEFDGGYILIQEGITTPVESGAFEAHQKYLDVQILLEGAELIEWANVEELTVSVPYNDQVDRSNHFGSGSIVRIRPGMFYVCYPHDAHKCCCHEQTPTAFRKAVVKLENTYLWTD